MRTRALAITLLLGSTGMGCRSTAAHQSPGVIVGLYETGFEPRGFRFCDTTADGGVWRPVQLPAGVTVQGWPGTPTGMSARMHFVRWRGALAEPVAGGTGRPRAIIVEEVLEVRAARAGDCGWTPA